MKIWISGLCGFLGSHLAQELLKQGHFIYGNDNLLCGDLDNIAWGNLGLKYIVDLDKDEPLDCCDFDGMYGALSEYKPDVLVHTAAVASEGLSVFSPSFVTRNVAEASVATFSAAIAAGVKRIVYFSSMARYGKGNPPFKETDPTNPVDCYGVAKVYAEQQLKVLCETHGVKWSIVCPHNVVGTRQQISPYRNVISIFLNRLKLGLPVYIYGDGEQKRSFSPVRDCLHSLMKVVDGGADGEIINIGPDDDEITINEVLKMCERITGIKANVTYLPPRPVTDTVKEAYCSSEKARKLLGFQPQQKLEDCVQEMSDTMKPAPFKYNFPLEITKGCPRTWLEKL